MKQRRSLTLLWLNPATGVKEAIPRHNEIKESLARKILSSLGAS